MFGFLEGLHLHTSVYEAKLSERENVKWAHADLDINTNIPSYTQYRDDVLDMVRDILHFRMKSKATVAS